MDDREDLFTFTETENILKVIYGQLGIMHANY